MIPKKVKWKEIKNRKFIWLDRSPADILYVTEYVVSSKVGHTTIGTNRKKEQQ